MKFNDQHIPDSPYLVPVCAPPHDARRLTVNSLQVRHKETSPHRATSAAVKEQGSILCCRRSYIKRRIPRERTKTRAACHNSGEMICMLICTGNSMEEVWTLGGRQRKKNTSYEGHMSKDLSIHSYSVLKSDWPAVESIISSNGKILFIDPRESNK